MTGQVSVSSTTFAECHFVDVGQGTCNVVALGNNQAIVVDCGPRGFTPIQVLRRLGIHEIATLVISHNDADHAAGVAQLLQAFPRRIREIYILEDRPNRRTALLPVLRREQQADNLLSDPIRLEAPSAKGKCIFEDKTKGISLHVLFPWMMANIDAREQGGRNKTSAVLALQCGQRRIVFGGDLEYVGWRQLRQALGAPVRCDLLAAPHHGGALSDTDSANRHEWIYREAVCCGTAVVSVGSSNQHQHPLQEHTDAVLLAGAYLMCTQITPNCCDALERLRPGVIAPTMPGASSPTIRTTAAGRSRHVACAGSILVEIGPADIRIDRINEHRAAVDALARASDGHPLCRRHPVDGSHSSSAA